MTTHSGQVGQRRKSDRRGESPMPGFYPLTTSGYTAAMSQPRARSKLPVAVALALILVGGLPIAIGAAALVEEKFIGTFYIAQACRAIGIFGPLRQLARWFGFP